MSKSKRAVRRAATRRICDRRHRIWVHVGLGGDSEVNVMGREPGRMRKMAGWCCNCRKRRHGRPRQSIGMCDLGIRSRIYQERAKTRELRQMFRRGEVTEEALERSF